MKLTNLINFKKDNIMQCDICKKESNKIICDDCFNKIKNNHVAMKNNLLDRMDLPIFVVDNNTKIYSANDKMLNFIGKTIDEINDTLGGDFIECLEQEIPGTCGKMKICERCELRNFILKTIKTGRPQETENITHRIRIGGKPYTLKMNVSMKMKNDFVFVQINDYNIYEL